MKKKVNMESFYCPSCGSPLRVEVTPYGIEIECCTCIEKHFTQPMYYYPIPLDRIEDIKLMVGDCIIRFCADVVEDKMDRVSI